MKASYNRYENKLAGATAKADQFGLAMCVYSLSKRTSVYGTLCLPENSDGSMYRCVSEEQRFS